MAAPTTRPRILLWDIETIPIVTTTWSLFKPILSHEDILEESLICCASWKWYGQKEIYADWINPARPKNDKKLITHLHKVLAEADILVAHNGDKFDLRKFNTRAIYHKLKPLPKIPTIDTLKVARRLFYFNSNRLDYLGKFLLGRGKIHTEKEMWKQVMKGNEAALAKMVAYNKGDVTLLEDVYTTLRPYIKNHPNAALYTDTTCCPNCGSEHFQKRGFKYQATTKRQQYQCQEKDCGAWFSGKFVSRTEVR